MEKNESRYYNVDLTLQVSEETDSSEIEDKINENLPDGQTIEDVVLAQRLVEVAR